MKLSKTLILFLSGFSVSVLVLLISLYFTYSTEESLQDQFNEWEQVHFVVENTKTIINTLYKAENGVRAYIITRDESHINDLQNHINSVLLLSNELTRVSKGDSSTFANMKQMCDLGFVKY